MNFKFKVKESSDNTPKSKLVFVIGIVTDADTVTVKDGGAMSIYTINEASRSVRGLKNYYYYDTQLRCKPTLMGNSLPIRGEIKNARPYKIGSRVKGNIKHGAFNITKVYYEQI